MISWDTEELSDNSDLCKQCKNCKYRDKGFADLNLPEEDIGSWQMCYCQIFGKDTVLRSDHVIPYVPKFSEDKPDFVIDGTHPCEYYIEEIDVDTERTRRLYSLYRKYCRSYYQDLDEDGCPVNKDPAREIIIWAKIRTEGEF